MAGDVFISYRWGPTSSDAVGRLAEVLKDQLGRDAVCVDIDSRNDGTGLRRRILDQLKAAEVILIVIHPDWSEAVPRLRDAEDLVRFEIEAAQEFGLKAIPVLLNGATLPKEEDLPESLKGIPDLPSVTIATHLGYKAEVSKLAADIKAALPNATLRALRWVANNSPMNATLALMILGALMLFGSHILNIHTLMYKNVSIETRFGVDIDTSAVLPVREAGLLMAWNWSVALLLITPAMFLLSANTLRHAKQLLDTLQHRKMMYYVDAGGQTTPLTARRQWEAVARPSAVWCQAFAVLAFVLGVYQWWQYSGQWYFKRQDFDSAAYLDAFMMLSTGPDWNIAWAIVAGLRDNALVIALFVLLMYLVYGIGSALTYSYYAFLFNFFAELSQLATSAGVRAGMTLRLDVADRDAGGLATFRTIQRDHAVFCFWTLFAMYLMALRNAYLPLVCRLPAGVSRMFADDAARMGQCSNMAAFSSNIYYSSVHFVRSLFSGAPDFGILFHAYSEQNQFVMGPALYVVLIASFFFLISSRMRAIVETARHEADPQLAAGLLRRIKFENGRVLTIMAMGALSVVFLNLGPIVVALALVLFPIEQAWSRVTSRQQPRVAQA